MRWLRRHLRIGLGLLVVAAIVAVALWPQSMEVEAVQAARGPMRVTIDEEGETRVRDRFVVSAPLSGRLQRIELEPGDPVVRGTTIVARLTPAASPLLDPRTRSELSAAVEAARAAVGQAQAERLRTAAALERARTTMKRREALAGAGAIARDDLDAAQTALTAAQEASRAAEFTVARAESELQLARARLQTPGGGGGTTVDVVAPVDGVVLRRLRESESVVPIGEPLLHIGDPSRIEIVSDLLSTDAVRVMPGARVIVEQWGGPHPLEGTVRRVEPSGFMKVSALGVEEQRVNVIVDLAQPPSGARLGDGYRVEIQIVTWEAGDVLKLPVGALFRPPGSTSGDSWAVFAIEEQRAVLRAVQLGQRNDTEAEITGGLTAGQAVVLHPPDTLTDGTRVIVRGVR
jgi:HlyD family secretion protein